MHRGVDGMLLKDRFHGRGVTHARAHEHRLLPRQPPQTVQHLGGTVGKIIHAHHGKPRLLQGQPGVRGDVASGSGQKNGRHGAADARAAAEAILNRLEQRGIKKTGFRTPEMAKLIAADTPDSKQYVPQPNTLDPRKMVVELDQVVPKDWEVVIGAGHYFSMAMTFMKGRPAERYHVVNDFGAIGSALPAAIGIAAARNDGKVLLVEGDGSLMMHVQELETIRRQGIKMLMAIMNDGGYGAEVHKFRANGVTEKEAVHGRGDLAAAATGFGLRGASVTQPNTMAPLFQQHQGANIGTLWDVHIDDKIVSRAYRRIHYGEA